MSPPWITHSGDRLLVLGRALWGGHDAGNRAAAALARAVVAEVMERGPAIETAGVCAAVRAAVAATPGAAEAGLHLGVAARRPASGWHVWTTGRVSAFERSDDRWRPLTAPRTLATRLSQDGQPAAPSTAEVATHLAGAGVNEQTFVMGETQGAVALAGGPLVAAPGPADDPESAWVELPLAHDPDWRAAWAQRDGLLAPAREWWLALGEPSEGFLLAEGLTGFEDALASLMVLGEPGEAERALGPLRAAWPEVCAAADGDRELIPELGAATLAVAVLSQALPPALAEPPATWFDDLSRAHPPLPPARLQVLGAAVHAPWQATAGPTLRGWPARQGAGEVDFADLALAALLTFPGEPPERLAALRWAVRHAAAAG